MYTGSWSNSNQLQIWDVRKLSLNFEVHDIESTYIYTLKVLNTSFDNYSTLSNSKNENGSKLIIYCGSNRNVVGLYELNNQSIDNSIIKKEIINKSDDKDEMKNSVLFETKYVDKPCLCADFNLQENILSSSWGDGIIRNYKVNKIV